MPEKGTSRREATSWERGVGDSPSFMGCLGGGGGGGGGGEL